MSSDLKDIISSVGTIVQSLSTLVVALLAFWGLKTWRRQMVGQGRYESVRRLLILARQFRGAFARSRGMFTYSHEYEGRPHSDDETPEKARILDQEYARRARLQPAIDKIIELEQAVWEAEIITGEEIVSIAKAFGDALSELNNAITEHFDYRLQETRLNRRQTGDPDRADRLHRTRLIIYRPLSAPDELDKRVDQALEELERRLRKYVR